MDYLINDMSVEQFIRKRKELGISKTQLAKLFGVTYQTVNNIEKLAREEGKVKDIYKLALIALDYLSNQEL